MSQPGKPNQPRQQSSSGHQASKAGGVPPITTPPPPPIVPGEVIIERPSWWSRAWNKVKGFFRTTGRGIKRGAEATKNGVVTAWDYVTVRLDMLFSSIINGLWLAIRWIASLPFRLISYFWETNSNKEAVLRVEAKQYTRVERRRRRKIEMEAERAERAELRRRRATAPDYPVTV